MDLKCSPRLLFKGFGNAPDYSKNCSHKSQVLPIQSRMLITIPIPHSPQRSGFVMFPRKHRFSCLLQYFPQYSDWLGQMAKGGLQKEAIKANTSRADACQTSCNFLHLQHFSNFKTEKSIHQTLEVLKLENFRRIVGSGALSEITLHVTRKCNSAPTFLHVRRG